MELFELGGLITLSDYHEAMAVGVASRDTESGLVRIIRAGPFIPPIVIPWIGGFATIVTDEFRGVLEERLPDLRFRQVVKSKIVEYPWETWDFKSIPVEGYPDDLDEFRPIDYIEYGDHSPEAAARSPVCWEVLAPSLPMETTIVELLPGFVPRKVAKVGPGEYRGLFTYPGNHYRLIVDRPTRDWLTSVANDWVTFPPLEIEVGADPAQSSGPAAT